MIVVEHLIEKSFLQIVSESFPIVAREEIKLVQI